MNNLNKIPIHDSSLRHSTGQAIYIDDMPEQENLLHGTPVLSKVACGKIKKINSDKLKDLPFFTKITKSSNLANPIPPNARDSIFSSISDPFFNVTGSLIFCFNLFAIYN